MIPTMCLGMCLLELALPIVFFFMCKRLYVQKAVIGDSHGAETLPLGIGFPQYSTHIDIETQQLCRPLPEAAQADCACIVSQDVEL